MRISNQKPATIKSSLEGVYKGINVQCVTQAQLAAHMDDRFHIYWVKETGRLVYYGQDIGYASGPKDFKIDDKRYEDIRLMLRQRGLIA